MKDRNWQRQDISSTHCSLTRRTHIEIMLRQAPTPHAPHALIDLFIRAVQQLEGLVEALAIVAGDGVEGAFGRGDEAAGVLDHFDVDKTTEPGKERAISCCQGGGLLGQAYMKPASEPCQQIASKSATSAR